MKQIEPIRARVTGIPKEVVEEPETGTTPFEYRVIGGIVFIVILVVLKLIFGG